MFGGFIDRTVHDDAMPYRERVFFSNHNRRERVCKHYVRPNGCNCSRGVGLSWNFGAAIDIDAIFLDRKVICEVDYVSLDSIRDVEMVLGL